MLIAKEEFELVKNKHRALIATQMCNHEWDEEEFKRKLEEATLKECIQTKAEQMLAIQFGLEEDLSFEAFLKSFKEENARRNEMRILGEKVFGPTQYTLEQYYTYINYNRKKVLHREMIRRGMVTEGEILEFYKCFKDKLYRKSNTYTLQIYREDQVEESQWIKEIEIHPRNISMYEKQYPELIHALKDIQEGETISLKDAQGQVYLIHCEKKQANGCFDLVEVKDNIKDRIARGKQEGLVEDIIKKVIIAT